MAVRSGAATKITPIWTGSGYATTTLPRLGLPADPVREIISDERIGTVTLAWKTERDGDVVVSIGCGENPAIEMRNDPDIARVRAAVTTAMDPTPVIARIARDDLLTVINDDTMHAQSVLLTVGPGSMTFTTDNGRPHVISAEVCGLPECVGSVRVSVLLLTDALTELADENTLELGLSRFGVVVSAPRHPGYELATPTIFMPADAAA